MLSDGCPCVKCTEKTNEKLKKAREMWNNGQRNIMFYDWHWQCGDGCCDEYGLDMVVNGYALGNVDNDPEHAVAMLMSFLEIDTVNIDRDNDYEL